MVVGICDKAFDINDTLTEEPQTTTSPTRKQEGGSFVGTLNFPSIILDKLSELATH